MFEIKLAPFNLVALSIGPFAWHGAPIWSCLHWIEFALQTWVTGRDLLLRDRVGVEHVPVPTAVVAKILALVKMELLQTRRALSLAFVCRLAKDVQSLRHKRHHSGSLPYS